MGLYKQKNSEYWYADVEVSGKRVRRSTHNKSKREAQKVHDQIKQQLNEQKNYDKTLADALSLWLKIKPRSENDKSAIRVFLRTYENRPLCEVDGYEVLDEFLSIKASTYNRYINIISASLNLAFQRKWCDQIKLIKRDKEATSLRFLSREEWDKIQTALPIHLLPIATFALSTGMRKSNVLNLKWSQIDMKNERVRVDATMIKSKNHTGIKLNKAAMNAVKSQVGKNSEYVFTYQGKQISDIKTAWRNALKRAGVKHLRWHSLRTTWASWHVMEGTTLAELKELGGWASLDMVLIYAHLAPNHSDQSVDNVSNYGL